MKILVVEDEQGLREALVKTLGDEGYLADGAGDGGEGYELIRSGLYDLVILDIMLPVMDGLEVLRRVRKDENRVPVILLTARSTLEDKVGGIDLGADDYMTKPFSTGELLARLRAALRHASQRRAAQNDAAQAAAYRCDGLCVDYGKHRVFLDGVDIHLTQIEYRILELLTRHAGRVLTYDYIIKSVWGASASFDKQILRVNMANIRRKLESNPAAPKYLKTEIGVGYWIKEEE